MELNSENPSRVLQSQEISDEEHKIIKGDTVGETLFSGKWVLNVLISLTKVNEDGWNDSIENDLCTLWDMTTEKDIVTFLIENNFFQLAVFTLKSTTEERLREIIVGIIGNMCCGINEIELLGNTDELVFIILSLLCSEETDTLLQVIRILRAVMWNIESSDTSIWVKIIEEWQIFGYNICFVLNNSLNDELLTNTISLVKSIAEVNGCMFLYNIFDIDQLIFALCESVIELIKNEKDYFHVDFKFNSIGNWLSILIQIIEAELFKFSDSEKDNIFKQINLVLLKILQPYENLTNLVALENKCLFYIQSSIEIFSLQKNEMIPNLQLIKIILYIMVNLQLVLRDTAIDDFIQLQRYIKNYWTDTLKLMNEEQIVKILELCDTQTLNKIIEISTERIPDIPENCSIKLLQAKSLIS